MSSKEIDKFIDEFFDNPVNRLIFERLGQIDEHRPMDWEFIKTGKRRNEKHRCYIVTDEEQYYGGSRK